MTIRDLINKRMIGREDEVRIFIDGDNTDVLCKDVPDFLLYVDFYSYSYNFSDSKWIIHYSSNEMLRPSTYFKYGYLPDTIFDFVGKGILTVSDYFIINVSDPYNMSFFKKVKYTELEEVYKFMKIEEIVYQPDENKYIFYFEFTERGERHYAYKKEE